MDNEETYPVSGRRKYQWGRYDALRNLSEGEGAVVGEGNIREYGIFRVMASRLGSLFGARISMCYADGKIFAVRKRDMDGLYVMKWDYRFLFGKYRACRVDEVFHNGWYGKSYIAWAYYNKPDVTFADEILDAVKITERIEKPGTDPDKYYEWLNTLPEEVKDMVDTYQRNVKLGALSHRRSVTKKYYSDRLARHEKLMEKASSAGRLQWKNQGHK